MQEHDETLQKYNDLLQQYNQLKTKHDTLESLIKELFLHEEHKFDRDLSGRPDSNSLWMHPASLLKIFNLYFKERFLKETGLEVDKYWKISMLHWRRELIKKGRHCNLYPL